MACYFWPQLRVAFFVAFFLHLQSSEQSQHPADLHVKPDTLELEEALYAIAYFSEWATMRADELAELIRNAQGQEKDVLKQKQAKFDEAVTKWDLAMWKLASDRIEVMKPTGKLSKDEEKKVQAILDEVKAFGESIKLQKTLKMVALASSRSYLYDQMVNKLSKHPEVNVPYWNVAKKKVAKLDDALRKFIDKYRKDNFEYQENFWYDEYVNSLNAAIVDAKKAVLKLWNSTSGEPEKEDSMSGKLEPEKSTPGKLKPVKFTPGMLEPVKSTPGMLEPEKSTLEMLEPEKTTSGKLELKKSTSGEPEPEDSTSGEPEPEDSTSGEPEPEDSTSGEPEPEDSTSGEPEPEDSTSGEPESTDSTPRELKLDNSMPGMLKKLGHFAKKYGWIPAGLVLATRLYYGAQYFFGSADQLVNQTKSVTCVSAFTAVTKGFPPLLVVVIILLVVAILTGCAYYYFQKQRQAGSKKKSTRKSCKKKSKTASKSSKLTTQSPNQDSKLMIQSTGKSSLQTAQVATTSPSFASTKATSKPKTQSTGSVIKQKTKSATSSPSSALTPVTSSNRR